MAVKIASLVKFYSVLLLMEKPKHGYEIMKELEEKIGKKISTSQVYPFLELLEKEKFIRVDKTGARDKIIYVMTKKGKEFTKKMLSRSGDLFFLALKPQVSVCTHCGCKVLEGGYKETVSGKNLIFCCCHCAKSFKK
ncbi:MAG: helix-turn-helix transcriptional regulator [archaeon]